MKKWKPVYTDTRDAQFLAGFSDFFPQPLMTGRLAFSLWVEVSEIGAFSRLRLDGNFRSVYVQYAWCCAQRTEDNDPSPDFVRRPSVVTACRRLTHASVAACVNAAVFMVHVGLKAGFTLEQSYVAGGLCALAMGFWSTRFMSRPQS